MVVGENCQGLCRERRQVMFVYLQILLLHINVSIRGLSCIYKKTTESPYAFLYWSKIYHFHASKLMLKNHIFL